MNKEYFMPPVIDNAKADPTKKWQVRYAYRGKDGKRIVVRNSTGLRNNKISFDEKMKIATKLRITIYKSILEGRTNVPVAVVPNCDKPVYFALQELMKYKECYINDNTFKSFRSRIRDFGMWLQSVRMDDVKINEIEYKHILVFVEWLKSKNISNRSINNTMIDIRTSFSWFVKNEYCAKNPVINYEKLPIKSIRNKIFTKMDIKRIKTWCDENDSNLYLFCKFIMMGIRPQAAVQVKNKHIDTEEWKIILPAEIEKTKKRTVKVIFERFREEFAAMELHKYPADYYFFTTEGKPGAIPTTRDYFTRKFQKLKKALGLGREYTMYGFKHTIAVELFKNGTPIKDIMAITGHTTLSGFEAYIKEYLDEAPEDPSLNIKLDI